MEEICEFISNYATKADQNIGLSVIQLITDDYRYLDDIIKSITPEHVLIFSGNTEELNIFDEKFAQSKVNKYFITNLLKGKILTPEELDAFKNNIVLNLKKGSIDRQVIIEEDYFGDSDIWLDFNFTNEAFDVNQMFQGSNSVLIALAQNPTILQDPRLKVIFYKYMESLGINPQEIELAEKSMSMGGPTPGQFPATSGQPQLPQGTEGSPMGTSNMPMKANAIMK